MSMRSTSPTGPARCARVTRATPDLIVNAAALVDVEACEKQPDAAWKVNAMGSQNLALAARALSAEYLLISTDYVFDGTAREDYDEFFVTEPDQPVWKVEARGGKARRRDLANDVHREDLVALRSPAEELRGARADRGGQGRRGADGG